MRAPLAATIAGSDSSGSSGLQADLPTFAAHGVHASSVVTVVTAQDSLGVKAFHELPLDLVDRQLSVIVDDLAPTATKTGLLRSAAVVDLVAGFARPGRLGRLVVDPVMVDSSGTLIVDDETLQRYRELASVATVITPNRWEAELLVGLPLADTEAIVAAAPELRALGAELVVVTGGRSEGIEVIDVIVGVSGVDLARTTRVGDVPIRGTGCTFSAAITAHLALGRTPIEAATLASAFVARQLAFVDDLKLGSGRPGIPHRTDRASTAME